VLGTEQKVHVNVNTWEERNRLAAQTQIKGLFLEQVTKVKQVISK